MRFVFKFPLILLQLVGLSVALGYFLGAPPSEVAEFLDARSGGFWGQGPGFLAWMGFSFVACGLGLFLWELDWKHRRVRTTAEVTEAGEMSVYSEGEHLDCTVVSCRHQVGDVWHSGSFQTGTATNIGFISAWERARFAPGTLVSIIYDPDNPGDVARPKDWWSFTSIILLGLTGAGFVLLFLAGGAAGSA